MNVKLIFEPQNGGYADCIIKMEDSSTIEDIKQRYFNMLGLVWNDECSRYEVTNEDEDTEEYIDDFYKDMPDDFRNAVKVIKSYCQNEDCDRESCDECIYPLGVIRATDTYNYNLKSYRLYCEVINDERYNECKDKNCAECDYFRKHYGY